ncbi:MAG TPA: transcription termination/antitermination protein NusG [Patescibacteria group bacterium]|nr:transcription termination/antitermination protein NusG [Patescibacteria group bacterium]
MTFLSFPRKRESREKEWIPTCNASLAGRPGLCPGMTKDKSIKIMAQVNETNITETKTDNAKQGKWYIVHTYAGHENKVATQLMQRVETMGFQDRIFEVIVPTRDTIKVNQGEKRTVKEKIFPGYVLIRMILNDESWVLVRSTQGVTAFIGAGNKPTPISEKEVEAIQKFITMEQPLYKAAFTVGEAIKITDGPFTDFLGTVDNIDEARGKLKVLVSIFGRETPVELDFLQVKKI